MKENFSIVLDSLHVADRGQLENAFNLTPDQLKKREVIYIDIAYDQISSNVIFI